MQPFADREVCLLSRWRERGRLVTGSATGKSAVQTLHQEHLSLATDIYRSENGFQETPVSKLTQMTVSLPRENGQCTACRTRLHCLTIPCACEREPYSVV